MTGQDHVKRMLALTMGIGLAMCGPYYDCAIKVPRSKSRRGYVVGCHICGASGVTLYKDGDQRICGECRAKKTEVEPVEQAEKELRQQHP